MGTQHRAHILVVEDESIIALDVEDMLVRAGYNVTWCASVDAALQALTNDTFDCAVLDISVEGAPVVPVADKLASANVPFIVCSGHSIDLLPARLRDAPFVPKPFSSLTLLTALRGALLSRAI